MLALTAIGDQQPIEPGAELVGELRRQALEGLLAGALARPRDHPHPLGDSRPFDPSPTKLAAQLGKQQRGSLVFQRALDQPTRGPAPASARWPPRTPLDDFLECGQRCAPLGLSTLSAVPWRAEAALIHAALGNVGEARRLAGEQLELARSFGRPRTLGISLRACGLIEGGAAWSCWERLSRRWSARSQPLELARALSDYGGALRRAGRRVQARTELERALDLAHRCGARRIANQARAELIAAGAKPRRDAITGRDALTAGELRVARLAAEGLTNREIAQALFITTKTVKGHLSHVYRKLEITRRGQLADALTGLRDDSGEESSAAALIS